MFFAPSLTLMKIDLFIDLAAENNSYFIVIGKVTIMTDQFKSYYLRTIIVVTRKMEIYFLSKSMSLRMYVG